nr:MAG TPA: hypothetical protein [Bacteriophage sp.]
MVFLHIRYNIELVSFFKPPFLSKFLCKLCTSTNSASFW